MRTPKKSPKAKTQAVSKSKKLKLSDLTPKKDPKGALAKPRISVVNCG
jgi:hypothetical protein